MDGPQVGQNRVRHRICRGDDWRVIPRLDVVLTLVAIGTGVHHDFLAGVVQHQLAVDAHAVIEELVVDAQFVTQGKSLLVDAQGIQVHLQAVYHPNDLAAVHDELVQDHAVFVREGAVGAGHHKQVVLVVAPGHAFDLFAESVDLLVDAYALHRVGFRQGGFQIGQTERAPFALAFQDGDRGCLAAHGHAQAAGQFVFEVVDRGVDHGLVRLGRVAFEELHRDVLAAVGDDGRWPHDLTYIGAFVFVRDAGKAQALVVQGALNAAAGFVVFAGVRVDELILQHAVREVGKLSQPVAQALLQALEFGGQISGEVATYKHWVRQLLQQRLGGRSEAVTTLSGQVKLGVGKRA